MLLSPPAGELAAVAVAESMCFADEVESACSTPFVSAPSSPGHGPASGYFFSAPASPMHFLLSAEKSKSPMEDCEPAFLSSDSEFEFSSLISPNGTRGMAYMTSADELFLNGQIRPMKLSSHLRRPQEGMDLCRDDSAVVTGTIFRPHYAKFSHRKTRSMMPLRVAPPDEWRALQPIEAADQESGAKEAESSGTTPSCSASSSRSSSSGRNSKKWMFLKDLLHRSKSEVRANSKDRFWSAISFSTTKEKKIPPASPALSPSSSRDDKRSPATAGKPLNGIWRRRIPLSAHGLHYAANRAQAEEMKKKTFLPYRPGLLGCLGFSSKSYGAFNGFTRSLNPISSSDPIVAKCLSLSPKSAAGAEPDERIILSIANSANSQNRSPSIAPDLFLDSSGKEKILFLITFLITTCLILFVIKTKFRKLNTFLKRGTLTTHWLTKL